MSFSLLPSNQSRRYWKNFISLIQQRYTRQLCKNITNFKNVNPTKSFPWEIYGLPRFLLTNRQTRSSSVWLIGNLLAFRLQVKISVNLVSFFYGSWWFTAAHLHVAALADKPYSSNFAIFAESLHHAYGRRLQEKQAWWLSSDNIDSHIRSMWIIHGRELINSIYWKRDCGCQIDASEPGCLHQRIAVEKGVTYIRGAMNEDFKGISEIFLMPLYS